MKFSFNSNLFIELRHISKANPNSILLRNNQSSKIIQRIVTQTYKPFHFSRQNILSYELRSFNNYRKCLIQTQISKILFNRNDSNHFGLLYE